MRKPIWIAMLISAGFHAALLLIVLPPPDALPPTTHLPPEVRLIEGPAEPQIVPEAEQQPASAESTPPAEPADMPTEGAAEPVPAAAALRMTDGRHGEPGLPDDNVEPVPVDVPAEPEPSIAGGEHDG